MRTLAALVLVGAVAAVARPASAADEDGPCTAAAGTGTSAVFAALF